MTIYPDRGDGRKAHYGEGKQPWDTIRELGWEIPWLAGNIVKYLRRTKDPEHSIESAKVYYKRLLELCREEQTVRHGAKRYCLGANDVLLNLLEELDDDEMYRLGAEQ